MKRILPALFAVATLLVMFALVVVFSKRINLKQSATLDTRPIPALMVEEDQSPLPTPFPTTIPSPLDSIQLGEPRVVLTHSSAIGVIEWLPNSQEVLLTLQQPKALTETIEFLNIASGQRRFLAARPAEPARPIWLETLNRLAFVLRPNLSDVVYELRMDNPADSHNPQRLEQLGTVASMISGQGDRLLVVHNGQAEILQIAPNGQIATESPIDLKDTDFEPDNWRTRFRSEWSYSGDKVALYDRQGFVVLDFLSGQLRHYDLGEERSEAYGYGPRWVYDARWSPDGERIALITTVDESTGFLRYTDLTILDVLTGELVNTKIGQYITDVAWDPRGRFIATLINIGERDGAGLEGIFLVDGTNGQYKQFLPKQEFWGGQSGSGIAWNPSGKQIVMNCPTRLEGRLCLLHIQINLPSK